ncbi:MFS transporter [Petrotoga miotherma DSM 10691]|uniref:Major facilitator superfamily MFS_1 n=2 Tax=Petrotoga TaxID=28236 RepID=A9BGM0_PETMO|nr:MULTISPECIES: MFS transporter [Petrotoga]ABX32260.1 major facilitator superfamily MFS_1 [Petrotoga mobilis SJ95]PNR98919.1 MFS transporter [Petrotoga miotherma DSM 10691]
MSKSTGGLHLLIKNRNFLLLFFGRLVSSVGSAIFIIAILWSAAAEIGGVGAVSTVLSTIAVTNIIFSPFAGVWADRWKKKNILVITDLISGGILILLGIFFGTYFYQIWVLIITIFGLQICGTLFGPALLSLIPIMVNDDELSQANAMISMTDRLSQLIGMAIGGVIVSLVGIKWAILIDGLTFIFSAVSEMFIKAEEKGRKKVEARKTGLIFSDIKEGFKVIWTNVQLKGLITLETLDDFFGTTIFVFLPVLASEILKVGPGEYGIMQTMLGAGSFITAFVLSSIKEIKMKYVALMLSSVLAGVFLASLGIVNSYIYVLIALLMLGVMTEIGNINENLLIQRITPENTRGRVFALRSTIDNSLRPFSYAFAGIMAVFFSLKSLFFVFGIITSILGIFYLLIPYQLKKRNVF